MVPSQASRHHAQEDTKSRPPPSVVVVIEVVGGWFQFVPHLWGPRTSEGSHLKDEKCLSVTYSFSRSSQPHLLVVVPVFTNAALANGELLAPTNQHPRFLEG